MEAVEFLKTLKRFCMNTSCSACPLVTNGHAVSCITALTNNSEEAVDVIEKFAKDNPVRTRQSEFLKMFPNAETNSNGVLSIYPCDVDVTLYIEDPKTEDCEKYIKNVFGCDECRKEYWLKEI